MLAARALGLQSPKLLFYSETLREMAGLSILIPIFNRDVSHLVHSLLAQLPDWPGPAEIRLLDDGSAAEVRVQNGRWPRCLGSFIKSCRRMWGVPQSATSW